jgi:hypothetical protein
VKDSVSPTTSSANTSFSTGGASGAATSSPTAGVVQRAGPQPEQQHFGRCSGLDDRRIVRDRQRGYERRGWTGVGGRRAGGFGFRRRGHPARDRANAA